ncbi:Hypothetical protein I595_355 [Croceitalea dokdonensis DOKDO 023]|uniref:Scramblase family protein n=1 Tax=Croceitalea dokdonensis DOKDO 023 TaxID=1300341 RepID=A0A0N8H4I3_9FLAO|nr:hypothetical protein [Croceitalea dokdonensis]KPM33452.1 Hypothetical protein I595_355 [Croceitalea dokdonensis DOKDO 023]
MKDLNFPVSFEFKIGTISNDFVATDASGATLAYVRQKLFKFKEAIDVFSDTTKTEVNYRIKADKWIDFSTAYLFTDDKGNRLGKVARKGWASLWKAHYQIIDDKEKLQYTIREENTWVKVMDGIFGQIPILSIFTGYMFNPSYLVTDLQGKAMFRLKKEASFFGRRFRVNQLHETDSDDDHRIMLSLMMMVLLERQRG